MKTKSIFLLSFLIVLLGVLDLCSAKETLCHRWVAVSVDAAEGTQVAKADLRFARTAFSSVLTKSEYGGGPKLADDPLCLDCVASPEQAESFFPVVPYEYEFSVIIARRERPDVVDPELVYEDFTLKATLVDVFHGETVDGPYSVSWSLDPLDPFLADTHNKLIKQNAIALAQEFMPVDDAIHSYEAMPQSGELEPEKDIVATEETMKVTLNKLLDSEGKKAMEWQRLLIKVEKGTLENSVPRKGDYYIFEVGGGSIELEYKAPEECKKQTEKIKIHNTCDIDPKQLPVDVGDEIATTEFEIVCLKGRLEATLNPNYTVPYQASYDIVEEHTATLPFRLETTDDSKEFEVVVDEDFAEGTVKTKRVIISQQGPLTMEVHVLRTRAIHLRVPEGDVNLKRDPQRTLYFHIDLRVYDPKTMSWSVRPVAQGPTTSRETLSDTDWWFAHQFWNPVKEEHTKDVGVYRYRMHLEKETVEYLQSIH